DVVETVWRRAADLVGLLLRPRCRDEIARADGGVPILAIHLRAVERDRRGTGGRSARHAELLRRTRRTTRDRARLYRRRRRRRRTAGRDPERCVVASCHGRRSWGCRPTARDERPALHHPRRDAAEFLISSRGRVAGGAVLRRAHAAVDADGIHRERPPVVRDPEPGGDRSPTAGRDRATVSHDDLPDSRALAPRRGAEARLALLGRHADRAGGRATETRT